MIPLSATEVGRALRRQPLVHLHFPTRARVLPTPLPAETLRALAEAGPVLRLAIDNAAALAASPKEAA